MLRKQLFGKHKNPSNFYKLLHGKALPPNSTPILKPFCPRTKSHCLCKALERIVSAL